MKKNGWLCGLLLILCCGCPDAYSDEFVLVKDGKPQAAVVKNRRIAETQRFLIWEAGKCGVQFDLTAPAKSGNQIVFEVNDMPLETEDSFTIDFPDPRTMKIVCSPVSARWAVNHLLETAFGVRWLFPHKAVYGEEINDYPAAVNVAVERKKYTRGPDSFYLNRMIDWRDFGFASNWDAKMCFHGSHFLTVDVFPVWKYAPDQSWPEEIMPVLNGKKLKLPKPKQLPLPKNPYLAKKGYATHWNPCFTNPRTAEIAIENILVLLQKDPAKRAILLGLNDNGGMCECDTCRKAVGKKRNSGGYPDWSGPYWQWVNHVAEAVSAKYPEVWFVGSAYREVMDPPSFGLHPKVIVKPCFEIYAMREPSVMKRRLEIMQKWSECCRNINFGDYSYGLDSFLLPRPLFRHQAAVLKAFHQKYHVRGFFQEASFSTPFEGPKFYQTYRLLRDIDTDPEAPVTEWCRIAVGGKAAPALRQYYQFWEDYWMGEDIRRTDWYSNSVNKIYMQLKELSTHTFALKRGDMAKLRKLLTEVVEKAETPQQKRRAKIIMTFFELSESAVQMLFSEIIPPDGKLTSAADAVELLKQVPAALDAKERFEKNTYWKFTKKKLDGAMLANIGKVVPFLNDPEVRNELKTLETNDRLPLLLRRMIRIWQGAEVPNLIANGSFEQPGPLPAVRRGNRLEASRGNQNAQDGIYVFGAVGSIKAEFKIPVKQGKTYLLIFSAFCPQGSAEGRLNYMLTPRRGKSNSDHIRHLNLTLTGGSWQTFTAAVTISNSKNADNMLVNIWTANFEKNEPIWIDNVRVYCLDDLDLEG